MSSSVTFLSYFDWNLYKVFILYSTPGQVFVKLFNIRHNTIASLLVRGRMSNTFVYICEDSVEKKPLGYLVKSIEF